MSNYHIKHLEEYFQVYRKSVRNPESFWDEIAEEHFVWRKKWHTVLDYDFEKPEIKWFDGAQLNITENCIDRHLHIRGDKTAILLSPMTLKSLHNILPISNCMPRCASLPMCSKKKGLKKVIGW